MEPYGVAHLAMLGLFVVGVPAAVLLGRHDRGTGARRVSRALALLVLAAAVPFLVLDLATRFEVGVSLPLHLSDLAWMAAALALWTRWRWAVALTYFWGLVLTTQAIVTPSLGEDFPDPRFFGFWALHLLVVWAALYLVWGLGLAPRWREYGIVLGVTLGWAVTAFGFNLVAQTNYGYLVRKPASGSALDLLGPWPVYVAAEVAIVALVWALMTWPWVRREEAATGSG
ncbi:TIGR02206 family membrane protein [Nocardioides sp.]|uniref:YwaF family protein n=1 Tax=Nocardioides sp. TaxID=35761 RepID=UPI00321A4B60